MYDQCEEINGKVYKVMRTVYSVYSFLFEF